MPATMEGIIGAVFLLAEEIILLGKLRPWSSFYQKTEALVVVTLARARAGAYMSSGRTR